MNSIQDIWDGILELLSSKLTPTSINTWFDKCQPIELRNGALVVHTPNVFKRDIIQQRFSQAIKDALRDLFSSDFDLIVLAGDELADYRDIQQEEKSLPEMDGYTFDNFIVGASNKFAHGAALGVVRNPGSRAYNPLFIYGNSGLGKTHLLRAIGSAIHENDPKRKILFVKGEDFLNEMVHSLKEGRAEEFRQKYRQVDLFLMDDIQFIAGKESTQEEFFHTFESIYSAGNQIVLTSDRPPRDMATLDDRLRTRFEGGLMADIQAPDKELRIAIIRDKAGHMGLELSDEVVIYIADRLTSNIRQIEGVIKKISAYSGMGEDIDRELVDQSINDVIQSGIYIPTPDDIIHETARYFQVMSKDIKGQSRQKNIANARHVAAYLIRILTNYPLQTIGSYLNRDHATINASIKKIEKDMKTNPETSNTVRDITSNINSRHR
ncbi:MAG: chromosomal replication initiator protein DnaA [Oscillospiraceae bacterium]|nr:chromosomal replication initiator protein DnaA [Oscillospiraceae bacterium]